MSVVDPSGKLLMSWAEGLLRLSDDHGALVLTPPPSKLSLLTTRRRSSPRKGRGEAASLHSCRGCEQAPPHLAR